MPINSSQAMRAMVIGLAVWYGMTSADGMRMSLQQWAAARFAAATDFPCRQHRCACQSSEQCLLHCCCGLPVSTNTPHAPAEQRVLPDERLSPQAGLLAVCTGPDEADQHWRSQDIQKHVLWAGATLTPQAVATTSPGFNRQRLCRGVYDLPDKIPIYT